MKIAIASLGPCSMAVCANCAVESFEVCIRDWGSEPGVLICLPGILFHSSQRLFSVPGLARCLYFKRMGSQDRVVQWMASCKVKSVPCFSFFFFLLLRKLIQMWRLRAYIFLSQEVLRGILTNGKELFVLNFICWWFILNASVVAWDEERERWFQNVQTGSKLHRFSFRHYYSVEDSTLHNDHNEGHANTSFRISKLVQNCTISASDIATVWRIPPALYNRS